MWTRPENVREVSDDPEMRALVWGWHQRRPGFNSATSCTFEEMVGPNGWHYMFWWDGRPLVCVSLQEHRKDGYEVFVAAAEKTHPQRVKDALAFVGDRLMQNPNCRLASWVPANHRAAVRLNRQFLNYEIEREADGERWLRFGADLSTWWAKRHGQEIQNPRTSV